MVTVYHCLTARVYSGGFEYSGGGFQSGQGRPCPYSSPFFVSAQPLGMVTRKVAPLPGSLRTLTLPPYSSTSCFTIASPSPAPAPSLWVLAGSPPQKRSKTRGTSSARPPRPPPLPRTPPP